MDCQLRGSKQGYHVIELVVANLKRSFDPGEAERSEHCTLNPSNSGIGKHSCELDPFAGWVGRVGCTDVAQRHKVRHVVYAVDDHEHRSSYAIGHYSLHPYA